MLAGKNAGRTTVMLGFRGPGMPWFIPLVHQGSSKASSRPSIRSARSASVHRAAAQRPAKRSVGSVARLGPGRVKASIRL